MPRTAGHRAGDEAFFRAIETHRVRTFIAVMRRLPGDPRCAVCRAPFGGSGGRVMRRFGYGPSRKNPRLCAECFERAPVGGTELEVGVLFADVRGFTPIAERQDPEDVVRLLNRFYEAAVEVLCRHAIIDKLVGDEVMALYLPQLLGDRAASHMVGDARDLLAATPPELRVGIGLDHGRAYVGNVGSGEVKDFTAIGDVVNTAARLQGLAASGEILLSRAVATLSDEALAEAEPRTVAVKGKTDPLHVLALGPARQAQTPSVPL
jgi:adenylate cyclase